MNSSTATGDARFDEQVRTAHFYDALGVKEWLRLESDPRMRVVHHLHTSVLRRYIREGDRVLDAGCGAGRFSVELAGIGAIVTAGDLSAEQTVLASQALQARAETASGAEAQLSVSDLPFRPGCFDAVVCFGSVLSHLGTRAECAARELARVIRQGGLILLSVQSARNYYLPDVLSRIEAVGLQAVDDAMMEDRELPGASGVPWRQFTQEQLEQLAAAINCNVELVTASNVLATVDSIPILEELEKDETLWQTLLRWEEHLGTLPGNAGRGAHTIAVLRKQ